jgi:[ribosomal protein S5]-alanine N-acetyltransferase
LFNTLFHTSRLKIRNLRESDLEAFYQYRSNPEITKYQGFDVFTRKQAKDFIDDQKNKFLIRPGEWVQYGIEHIENGQLVGDCAIFLQERDSRIAETGITISNLFQKQGFAKETMQGLVKFLFNEKGIHRIVETVDAENTASIQMLKSVGFRQEALFVENIFLKGRWSSEYQFALLQKEWAESGF